MAKEDAIGRARETFAENQRKFHAAHKAGMAALRRRDYKTLSQAIADESDAIARSKIAIDSITQTPVDSTIASEDDE